MKRPQAIARREADLFEIAERAEEGEQKLPRTDFIGIREVLFLVFPVNTKRGLFWI